VEKQPVPIKSVRPAYPPLARQAKITGKVFVSVLVGREGKVEAIGQLKGPEVFYEVVRAAARQWEFAPAIQNDRPVKTWVSIPFNFAG
jgi:periplasmic protein TonB